MVKITKPYFHLDEKTRVFKNLMGEEGSVVYRNHRGAMVRINDSVEVFVPNGAYEKTKSK